MLRVGKIVSIGVSVIIAGLLFVAPSSAATIIASKANPLVNVPLLYNLGGAQAGVSGVLPDGGTWYDSSYVATPAKTTVIGNIPDTYTSTWAGSAWEGTAKYWTTGTDAAPSPNAPNPGILVFDHSHSSLTMLWGSVDIYNSISFYLGGSLIDTITGSDILALDANLQAGKGIALINFIVSGGGLFDRVMFSSSVNAFEVSNLTVNDSAIPNVPLPSTLILLGSLLGGFGFFGSRRRKASVSFG